MSVTNVIMPLYHSMQRPTECNEDFPVLHYNLTIEELNVTRIINASNDRIIATLSSLQFPDLKADGKYSVKITACTEFSCKSLKSPLTVCKSQKECSELKILCIYMYLHMKG